PVHRADRAHQRPRERRARLRSPERGHLRCAAEGAEPRVLPAPVRDRGYLRRHRVAPSLAPNRAALPPHTREETTRYQIETRDQYGMWSNDLGPGENVFGTEAEAEAMIEEL